MPAPPAAERPPKGLVGLGSPFTLHLDGVRGWLALGLPVCVENRTLQSRTQQAAPQPTHCAAGRPAAHPAKPCRPLPPAARP